MRERLPIVGALVVLLSMDIAYAVAKDLKALAEFVVPAYTAMNFALVCVRHDPLFLSQTSGPRGNALKYAEHVKDEAIASLTNEESVTVLKTAADAARTTALQTLRRFNSSDPAVEGASIKAWCGTDASNFVRTFISQHDSDHEMILRRLEQSKR